MRVEVALVLVRRTVLTLETSLVLNPESTSTKFGVYAKDGAETRQHRNQSFFSNRISLSRFHRGS